MTTRIPIVGRRAARFGVMTFCPPTAVPMGIAVQFFAEEASAMSSISSPFHPAAGTRSGTGREPHRRRVRSGLVILFALGLIAAACGDSSGGSAPATTTTTPTSAAGLSTTSTGPATTTSSPPTAPSVSTTTSTVSTATTTPASTTTVSPTTAASTTTSTASTTSTTAATTTTTDVTSLAEGSGCTPGSTTLPDGRWFGIVDSADASSVTFDLACWFTGDAAAVAAAQDGEESPPPNDYYVRNANPMLRTIPVGSLAEVAWMPTPGDPSTVEVISYPEWVTDRLSRSFQPPVWLNIEGGEIISIEEQYIP